LSNQTSPPPISSAQSSAQIRDTPTVYTDRLFARLFIRLFSHKMARAVGKRSDFTGYDGFVDLSKQIMQGRNAEGQQQLVAIVLQSLVPRPVLWLIRTLTRPTQLVCELNAWFAAMLFEWLVGPCEVKEVMVETATGLARSQRSAVQIQKCRYLEQSRCVGMCVNMCKLPTQKFFTEEFGIPLTMTPNFADFSCEMVFGQMPPPLATEDCYQQPCLDDRRGSAAPSCPKVRV
jgi:Beta-carotene isomerase D27-like, C-terminal